MSFIYDMAPRRSQAQKAHLALITAKRAAAEPDPAVKALEHKLQSAQTELSSTKDHLSTAKGHLHAAKEKYTAFYSSIRVERRKYQRTCIRKDQLEAQIKILQSAGKAFKDDAAKAVALLDNARSENTHLQLQLSTQMEKCALEAQHTMEKAIMLKAKLAASKHENKNLKQRCARIPEIKARAMKRAVKSAKKENTFKLVHKGIYGPQARALARTLVAAKCSQEYVGSVISAVCKSAGVAVQGKMSRRTVGRAIVEGGVASQVQVGYELAQAKCMLFEMSFLIYLLILFSSIYSQWGWNFKQACQL